MIVTLSRPCGRADAEHGTQLHARILQRRRSGGACPHHQRRGSAGIGSRSSPIAAAGHHAEIGQHGIASADPRVAVEDVPEVIALGYLLHVASRGR